VTDVEVIIGKLLARSWEIIPEAIMGGITEGNMWESNM